MIKALILDMDGLMIDSERLYISSEHEIARIFGKNLKEETIWKMMGRTPLESIKIFVKDLNIDELPEKVLQKRNKMMKHKLRNDLVPMPGLKEFLHRFCKKYELAVATGAPGEFVEIVLNQLNIRELFKLLVCSEDVKKGKPDPEIYRLACKKLLCKPREAVVLEDSANGALAAKRAGCFTIAVPSEYTCKQDFGCADYIARDLPEAGDFIINKIMLSP